LDNTNLTSKKINLSDIRINVNNNSVQIKANRDTADLGTNKFDTLLVSKFLEANNITFSKHSELRMQQRNINISLSQAQRLVSAINVAKTKGIKDGLIILDDYAMVTNIPKRTVITVTKKENSSENVFTNINGAIIA
jgi:flagellar operon protein